MQLRNKAALAVVLGAGALPAFAATTFPTEVTTALSDITTMVGVGMAAVLGVALASIAFTIGIKYVRRGAGKA